MQTPPTFSSPGAPLPPPNRVRFDAIGDAWRLYMADIGQWILSVLLVNLIMMVPICLIAMVWVLVVLRSVVPTMNTGGHAPIIPIGAMAVLFLMLLPFVIFAQLLNTGLQRRALLQVRGYSPDFGEIFKLNGMGRHVAAFAVALYSAIVIAELCLFTAINPFQAGEVFDPTRVIGVYGFIFILGCLQVIVVFAPLIIVDQRLAFWPATKKSIATFGPQFFPLLGILILTGILVECGVFACFIGIFFTMPLMYTIYGVIYNDFFRLLPIDAAEQPSVEQPNRW